MLLDTRHYVVYRLEVGAATRVRELHQQLVCELVQQIFAPNELLEVLILVKSVRQVFCEQGKQVVILHVNCIFEGAWDFTILLLN